MENEGFKIYVDRLQEGAVEAIEEVFSSNFLEQKSEELSFEKDVAVKGNAYLADHELIVHLDVHTEAEVPCSICNNLVKVPIDLEGLYLVESLDKNSSGVYLFKEPLREAILLEAPSFAECQDGHCPKRKEFGGYLSEEKKNSGLGESIDGYQPFKDLDL